MKLCTYRIHCKDKSKVPGPELRNFISDLYADVLYKDNNWHFFLDWDGGTLRFSPEFEERVRKYYYNDQITLKRRKKYSPTRDEYQGLRFVSKELQPIFHELSVIAATYPSYVLARAFWDRISHTFINQLGIHDFRVEANWLIDTAIDRAKLQQRHMLPKWVYKLYLWTLTKLPKWKKN